MSFPLDHSLQKERSELAQKGSLGRRRRPSRASLKAFISSIQDDPSDAEDTLSGMSVESLSTTSADSCDQMSDDVNIGRKTARNVHRMKRSRKSVSPRATEIIDGDPAVSKDHIKSHPEEKLAVVTVDIATKTSTSDDGEDSRDAGNQSVNYTGKTSHQVTKSPDCNGFTVYKQLQMQSEVENGLAEVSKDGLRSDSKSTGDGGEPGGWCKVNGHDSEGNLEDSLWKVSAVTNGHWFSVEESISGIEGSGNFSRIEDYSSPSPNKQSINGENCNNPQESFNGSYTRDSDIHVESNVRKDSKKSSVESPVSKDENLNVVLMTTPSGERSNGKDRKDCGRKSKPVSRLPRPELLIEPKKVEIIQNGNKQVTGIGVSRRQRCTSTPLPSVGGPRSSALPQSSSDNWTVRPSSRGDIRSSDGKVSTRGMFVDVGPGRPPLSREGSAVLPWSPSGCSVKEEAKCHSTRQGEVVNGHSRTTTRSRTDSIMDATNIERHQGNKHGCHDKTLDPVTRGMGNSKKQKSSEGISTRLENGGPTTAKCGPVAVGSRPRIDDSGLPEWVKVSHRLREKFIERNSSPGTDKKEQVVSRNHSEVKQPTVEPNKPAPVQSSKSTSVQPNKPAPVQSNKSTSVQPSKSATIQSSKSTPVQPNKPATVQPNNCSVRTSIPRATTNPNRVKVARNPPDNVLWLNMKNAAEANVEKEREDSEIILDLKELGCISEETRKVTSKGQISNKEERSPTSVKNQPEWVLKAVSRRPIDWDAFESQHASPATPDSGYLRDIKLKKPRCCPRVSKENDTRGSIRQSDTPRLSTDILTDKPTVVSGLPASQLNHQTARVSVSPTMEKMTTRLSPNLLTSTPKTTQLEVTMEKCDDHPPWIQKAEKIKNSGVHWEAIESHTPVNLKAEAPWLKEVKLRRVSSRMSSSTGEQQRDSTDGGDGTLTLARFRQTRRRHRGELRSTALSASCHNISVDPSTPEWVKEAERKRSRLIDWASLENLHCPAPPSPEAPWCKGVKLRRTAVSCQNLADAGSGDTRHWPEDAYSAGSHPSVEELHRSNSDCQKRSTWHDVIDSRSLPGTCSSSASPCQERAALTTPNGDIEWRHDSSSPSQWGSEGDRDASPRLWSTYLEERDDTQDGEEEDEDSVSPETRANMQSVLKELRETMDAGSQTRCSEDTPQPERLVKSPGDVADKNTTEDNPETPHDETALEADAEDKFQEDSRQDTPQSTDSLIKSADEGHFLCDGDTPTSSSSPTKPEELELSSNGETATSPVCDSSNSTETRPSSSTSEPQEITSTPPLVEDCQQKCLGNREDFHLTNRSDFVRKTSSPFSDSPYSSEPLYNGDGLLSESKSNSISNSHLAYFHHGVLSNQLLGGASFHHSNLSLAETPRKGTPTYRSQTLVGDPWQPQRKGGRADKGTNKTSSVRREIQEFANGLLQAFRRLQNGGSPKPSSRWHFTEGDSCPTQKGVQTDSIKGQPQRVVKKTREEYSEDDSENSSYTETYEDGVLKRTSRTVRRHEVNGSASDSSSRSLKKGGHSTPPKRRIKKTIKTITRGMDKTEEVVEEVIEELYGHGQKNSKRRTGKSTTPTITRMVQKTADGRMYLSTTVIGDAGVPALYTAAGDEVLTAQDQDGRSGRLEVGESSC